MTAIGTHYKPSQWRGKRLVYRSLDPDEPKWETRRFITFLVVAVVCMGIWILLLLAR
jgi:hypothetical protein